MRNIFNITIYELLNPGRPVVAGGDITPKRWFIEWCEKNLTDFRTQWYLIPKEQGRPARRLGLVLEREDDQMVFIMRWNGEWDSDSTRYGKHLLGPFTEEEMCQDFLPGSRHEEGEDG